MNNNNIDIVLNTLPLKITLAFNSQFKITDSGDVENGVEFNYSLIAVNPDLADVPNASKFKIPYFTNKVMYPEYFLLSNGLSDAINFFFNKEKFEEVLLANSAISYVNDKDPTMSESDVSQALSDNATFNVNLMLKILLPIGSEFGFALTSSFHRYVTGDYTSNIFPVSGNDIEQLLNSKKWIILAEGKPQYVQNVIWASSILDNPNYFYFLYVYNNSLVRRRNLTDQAKDDYAMRILVLMRHLRLKMQPDVVDATRGVTTVGKNLFDMILADLKEKKNGRNDSKERRRNEYDELLNTLLKEFPANAPANAQENAPAPVEYSNPLSVSLKAFVKGNEASLVSAVKDENDKAPANFDIDKDKVLKAIGNTDDMNKIQSIIDAIIRMHVIIHEYRESVRKSTTGTKQFNFEAQVSSVFDQAYRHCIGVKGMVVIKRFIDGDDQYMDLSQKNASGQEKTVEELDIIKFIETSNAQYRELNDAVSKGMKNVLPPRRESTNKLLQNELLKIKIESERGSQLPEHEPYSCEKQKKKPDFFRDVYSKYFYEGKGYTEFVDDNLFTGVSIYTSPEGVRNFEIFVVVDTVDKEKYDGVNGSACLVKDDNLANAFLNAISTKSNNKIGIVRSHESLNSAVVTPRKEPDNKPNKQSGGKRTRRRKKLIKK